MTYTVRWVESAEARDEHLDVWKRNLTLSVGARERFQWLYQDNPAGCGRLAVLEAGGKDSASFVGTAGYARRAMYRAGTVLDCAILADLAVDRAHRTVMPALMLAREVRAQALARCQVVYGFPNPHAVAVLRKMGYRLLGETRRFVLVLDHRRHIDQHFGRTLDAKWATWKPLVAPAATVSLNLLRKAVVTTRALPALRRYRLNFITVTDERFDRLWETARNDYPLVGVRDKAFIRWRFCTRPEGPLELAAMFAGKTSELLGYAAIAREGRIAHVKDLFGARAALPPLLRLLCMTLSMQNVESVSFRFLGAPWLAKTLVALGFRERGDHRCVLVDGAGARSSNGIDAPGDEASWYLTDADEDA